MKSVAIALGACLFGTAMAQPHMPTKRAQANPAVDNDPVSCAEARATFKKVCSLMHAVAHHEPTFAQDDTPDSDKPVTRAEVVEEMSRVFVGMRPYFKYTPRLAWYDSSVVTFSGSAKTAADRLIKWGFVDRMAPFATSKQPTISIAEFGDAVGIFISRTAELTHMPMPDYSPYLEKP